MRSMTALFVSTLVSIVALCAVGCGEPEHCRFDPGCGGGVGSFCGSSGDCDEGFCCRDNPNCGTAGMCTYSCEEDFHCPEDMACEHHMCFFRCAVDADCAAGQRCEHGNTICEWMPD